MTASSRCAEILILIQKIFVRHSGVKHATGLIEQSLSRGLGFREAVVYAIRGYSRCGKTETVKREIERHTRTEMTSEPVQLVSGNGRKILFVDVVVGQTVLGLCQMILAYLGDLRVLDSMGRISARKIREQDAVTRLIQVLADLGVDLVVMDEFQNVLTHKLDSAVGFIISIQNARRFPVLVTGTPEMDYLLAHPTITQRISGIAGLEPFANRTSNDRSRWQRFLKEFEAKLPFRETPRVWRDEQSADRMYFATRGHPGAVSGLFCDAASFTVARDPAAAELTEEALAQAFDMRLRNDRRMHGINPWKVELLPEIPLSVHEHDPIALPARRGRKRVLAI